MRLLLISIILISNALGFTSSQKRIYKLIMKEAPKYMRYKTRIAGICLTESSLGYYRIGDGGKSLGIMQIQVATVRFIGKRDKSLAYLLKYSNKRIASLLLVNDRLSIEIACKLFEYPRKRHGVKGATSRYNGGGDNISYCRRNTRNRKLLQRIKL